MAKRIKFALEMKDGQSVRDIEGLKEYFDLEKLVEHFKSGKLKIWLEDRRYDDEAEELDALDIKIADSYIAKLDAQNADLDKKIAEQEKDIAMLKKLIKAFEKVDGKL